MPASVRAATSTGCRGGSAPSRPTSLRVRRSCSAAATSRARSARAWPCPARSLRSLWDGRLLADGGIANNLPVSVARDLSDAPVIAIDVLRPSADVVERAALDLGLRAVRLLIENARPDSAPDILVIPDVPTGFAESHFPADAGMLLDAGYRAVREQVPPAATTATPIAPPGHAPTRVTTLLVTAPDAGTARLVERMMMPALGTYDADRIVRRVAALYATGLFHAVWPRLEYPQEGADSAALVIDLTPAAATVLAGAFRWDSDLGGGAWAVLRQRFG
jgi:hypothetical protein